MRMIAPALGLLALSFVAAAPALAETVTYTAALNAASETPPNPSPATGNVKATYDTGTKVLSWKAEYSGLTGAATAAHFHGPAPVGKPADVMVPLKGSLESPLTGSATLTDAQAKALTDGMMYLNVHTAKNKGGEIRGQLEKAM